MSRVSGLSQPVHRSEHALGVPEHRLPEGRDTLDWLARLGRALGYWPEAEWEVPDPEGPTFVDLAWLRRQGERVPLFLFEVESRPGSQLAENAQKVLSMPTELLPKPLFFFQLVLSGGGGRAGRAGRAHATANYGIYELEQPGERDRFLAALLGQHARAAEDLDAVALWDALTDRRAPAFAFSSAWDALERSPLDVPWASTYARLALRDPRFRGRLAAVLAPELDGEPAPADYGSSYWGATWSAPLHLGLLAALDPERGESCLAALRRWQANEGDPGRMLMIAPYPGLSRDYDSFVFFLAPYLWALLAALMARVSGAAQWICSQLRLIVEGRAPFVLTAPAAAWLLHLAEIFSCENEWHVAEDLVNEAGGLPGELKFRPPFGGPHFDDVESEWEAWEEALAAHPLPVDRAHFRHQMTFRPGAPLTSPVEIALQLLVYNDSIDRDHGDPRDQYGGARRVALLLNWLHRVVRPQRLGDRKGLPER